MIFKRTSFLFTLLCLLVASCEKSPRRPSDYVVMGNQLIRETAKQLRKEKDLIPIGDSGKMMGDIKSMGLTFQYHHIVNLEEARALLVYAVKVFLENINENKEIRPYLHEYPFTSKNIELVIFISQPNGREPNQGSLEVLTLRNGILTFKLVAPSPSAHWPVLHEETYETGLEILAGKS